MDVRHDLYSQFVSWSKILLPLAGLGLLSTMFLFARQDGPDPTISFAEIEEIAREARISAPSFAGVTADGSTIAITAQDIQPDSDRPDAFALNEIRTEIVALDGSTIILTAGTGELDPRAQVARMSGFARLTASSGYIMETDGLEADLNTGVVRSLGTLDVRTPFGDLTAGALEVRVTQDGQSQRMVFNEGVRLLYQPQN